MTITNNATLSTSDDEPPGIFVQSFGGIGGTGGGSGDSGSRSPH